MKSEEILERGIESLTKACDILTTDNKNLKEEIEGLRRKTALLQDEINCNRYEVE